MSQPDESHGSGWWFAVKEGLIAGKHHAQLGTGIWAYIALLRIADFDTGWIGLDPPSIARHLQDQLNVPRRTAYRWKAILERYDYIEYQEGEAYITNYDSAKTFQRAKNGTPVPKMAQVRAKNGTPSILYRDTTYRSLKGFYEAAIASINQASNLMAELRALWIFIWGEQDAPDFGRLGRAAKRAGNGQSRPGARVLLRNAVVALVGRRVVGNPIDYVEKMGGDGDGKRHTQLRRAGRGDPSEEESAASVYGRLWEERSRRNLEGS